MTSNDQNSIAEKETSTPVDRTGFQTGNWVVTARHLVQHTKPRTFFALMIFLIVYLTAGIYTELRFIEKKPLPDKLLSDFRLYQLASKEARNGNSPYHEVFFYPPPSLLVIDFFSLIPNQNAQSAFYVAVNILLFCLMIYGIACYYGLRASQTWFWYPLALGFAPFYETLHYGQINIITSFGIFLLFFAQQFAPLLVGMGLSLAIVTKFSPLVFLGYLGATRQYKAILWTICFVVLLSIIAFLRYGAVPFVDFPNSLSNLLAIHRVSVNEFSLVSRLGTLNRTEIMNGALQSLKDWVQPVQKYTATYPQNIQRSLLVYFGLILAVSGLITRKTQKKEPLFILTSLAVLLYPNLIWYHHFIFLILPLLIWMAFSNFQPQIIAWCLVGLLIVQLDRWHITYGLLIHIFGHASIWIILISQIKWFVKSLKNETSERSSVTDTLQTG
jgi:hypothetical protein